MLDANISARCYVHQGGWVKTYFDTIQTPNTFKNGKLLSYALILEYLQDYFQPEKGIYKTMPCTYRQVLQVVQVGY